MVHFSFHSHFQKQFEKLQKKYPSLKKDFELFCLARETDPTGYEPNIVRINWLGEGVLLPFYKVRKFPLTCMRLANSGIRIVYAYDGENKTIEFIEFVEIYHKSDRDNHDIELILREYTGITDILP